MEIKKEKKKKGNTRKRNGKETNRYEKKKNGNERKRKGRKEKRTDRKGKKQRKNFTFLVVYLSVRCNARNTYFP